MPTVRSGSTSRATGMLASSTSARAGSSRRARRTQNRGSRIQLVPATSRSSSVVMRNPLTTKNTSTPRNPPGTQAGARWNATTASTATARRPSSPGIRRPGTGPGTGAGRGTAWDAGAVSVGAGFVGGCDVGAGDVGAGDVGAGGVRTPAAVGPPVVVGPAVAVGPPVAVGPAADAKAAAVPVPATRPGRASSVRAMSGRYRTSGDRKSPECEATGRRTTGGRPFAGELDAHRASGSPPVHFEA